MLVGDWLARARNESGTRRSEPRAWVNQSCDGRSLAAVAAATAISAAAIAAAVIAACAAVAAAVAARRCGLCAVHARRCQRHRHPQCDSVHGISLQIRAERETRSADRMSFERAAPTFGPALPTLTGGFIPARCTRARSAPSRWVPGHAASGCWTRSDEKELSIGYARSAAQARRAICAAADRPPDP